MTHLVSTLFAFVLAAGPAEEVVVRPGETLAQVAKRTLGDAASAAELKAFNALTTDQVPEGTKLKLPGPERTMAVRTLKTAQSAVAQADVPDARRKEAESRLQQAETLFASARYREATDAADAAWRVVSEGKVRETRFTVDVTPEGKTHVKTVSGTVRVEAQNVSQPVYPGQEVRVEKGKPPPPPESPLPPPTLMGPEERARLERKGSGKGLGPVVLTWEAVAGATGYEVVVTPRDGKDLVLNASKPAVQLPPLREGLYRWTVRALAEGRRSEPAPSRSFELLRDLNIEAKTSPWK